MRGRSQLSEGSKHFPSGLICFIFVFCSAIAIFTFAPLSSVFSHQIRSVRCHHTQQLLTKSFNLLLQLFLCQMYPLCCLLQISCTLSLSLKFTCFLGIAVEEVTAIKHLSPHNLSASKVLSDYCSLNSLDASRSNFSCSVIRPAYSPEGKIKMIL